MHIGLNAIRINVEFAGNLVRDSGASGCMLSILESAGGAPIGGERSKSNQIQTKPRIQCG
jgi:hypothetical protein